MSKQILLILALSTFLFAGQDYSKKHFIFCLKNQMAKLSISSDRNNLVTNYPQINNLMIKNNVISVKKWLTSATDKDTWDGINFSLYYEATFDAERNLDEISAVIGEFKQLNEVQIAGYLPINRLCAVKNGYVPNDTYFDRQWYVKKIMADDAWALWNNQTPGDSSILIGIVDTGIDYLHPDLADAMYINPGEDIDGDGLITEADKNGVDDDDNGYIDDFMGWDFAGESGTSEDNDIRPPGTDENLNLSHGTHVAGIAAATADNNLGIAGVSFRSKIIATKHMADDDTSTYIQNGYDGILYCAKMGADIINCSWGGGDFSGGQAFINLIKNNYGSIIVCAAGNEDTDHADKPHYPSGYDNTIAVAATNVNDRKAYYSNYGDIIDISAPGGEGSTYANAIYSTIQVDAGSYTAFQGTSMSSPVVAGCL
ncbi:MAG: S8 family serine peptidase, partial [Calditrichaceae bacterium]